MVAWLPVSAPWEGRDQCSLSSGGFVECSLAPSLEQATSHLAQPHIRELGISEGKSNSVASTAPRLSQRP